MTARPEPDVVRPTLPVKGPYIMHSAVNFKLLVLTELFHVLKRLYLRHTALLLLILFNLSIWIALPVAEELLSPLHLLILALLSIWHCLLDSLCVFVWISWFLCQQLDVLRVVLVVPFEVLCRALMGQPLAITLCTVDVAFVVHISAWVVIPSCRLLLSETKQLEWWNKPLLFKRRRLFLAAGAYFNFNIVSE